MSDILDLVTKDGLSVIHDTVASGLKDYLGDQYTNNIDHVQEINEDTGSFIHKFVSKSDPDDYLRLEFKEILMKNLPSIFKLSVLDSIGNHEDLNIESKITSVLDDLKFKSDTGMTRDVDYDFKLSLYFRV